LYKLKLIATQEFEVVQREDCVSSKTQREAKSTTQQAESAKDFHQFQTKDDDTMVFII
jgi:hypothetical protein